MLLGEGPLVRTTATAATATGLISLPEVHTEGSDLEEVDVALGAPAIRPLVAVLNLGVVGDQVTRLEAEIFEEERVGSGNLPLRAAVEQPDRVLRATVDRVHEKQLGDAVVVVGLHLDIEFLDRTRVLITSGFGK